MVLHPADHRVYLAMDVRLYEKDLAAAAADEVASSSGGPPGGREGLTGLTEDDLHRLNMARIVMSRAVA